ncbi:uncharacterized protein SCHCODRAFT_02644178, partial [Schizophyllum commune H4-8]|uniref:uncharacterized protein n=1 Tax=Schizophyllum commune (strain H4-8 / FGSC 9210) TaxID=578458 RepID=UPI00216104EC
FARPSRVVREAASPMSSRTWSAYKPSDAQIPVIQAITALRKRAVHVADTTDSHRYMSPAYAKDR